MNLQGYKQMVVQTKNRRELLNLPCKNTSNSILLKNRLFVATSFQEQYEGAGCKSGRLGGEMRQTPPQLSNQGHCPKDWVRQVACTASCVTMKIPSGLPSSFSPNQLIQCDHDKKNHLINLSWRSTRRSSRLRHLSPSLTSWPLQIVLWPLRTHFGTHTRACARTHTDK